ncbi:MAG: sel1 repeat family protein [Magnetococcales bacterium]|nr:sel1 repeat family protein [Magnetococcales bacterium]
MVKMRFSPLLLLTALSLILSGPVQAQNDPANRNKSEAKTQPSGEQAKQQSAANDPFFSAYLKLAESGDLRAQAALGTLHLRRDMEYYSPKSAFNWFNKAARGGNKLAQFNLGDLYQKGIGVQQNDQEALHWFLEAVEPEEKGQSGLSSEMLAWCQLKLGLIYYHGKGAPVDDRKALDWFKKITPDNHAYAQYMVGLMHAQGRGVDKDLQKAFHWFSAAAAQGLQLAQEELVQLTNRPDILQAEHQPSTTNKTI